MDFTFYEFGRQSFAIENDHGRHTNPDALAQAITVICVLSPEEGAVILRLPFCATHCTRGGSRSMPDSSILNIYHARPKRSFSLSTSSSRLKNCRVGDFRSSPGERSWHMYSEDDMPITKRLPPASGYWCRYYLSFCYLSYQSQHLVMRFYITCNKNCTNSFSSRLFKDVGRPLAFPATLCHLPNLLK